VLKALAKNPLNRYQSAAEMRADMLRAASGRPVYATPLMPAEELPPAAMATQVVPPVAAGGRTGQMNRVAEARRRRRTSAAVIAVLSTLGVLAVIALVAGLILANQPDKKIAVPRVIGLTQIEAEQLIKTKGLSLTDPEMKPGTDCQKGKVIAQTPNEGTEVERNASVKLTVCGGPKAGKMPNVINQSKDIAERNLKNANLIPRFEEVDNEKKEGTVVATDPTADVDVFEGQTVTVKVSRGNIRAVPNLMNKMRADAVATLEKNGFTSEVQYQPTDDPTKVGKVIGQDPQPGTSKKTGETVTILIGQAAATPSATASPTKGTG
jgi:serine/threonine-protein kinase